MCIMCNSALASAFRDLTTRSRRAFLRGAAATAAGAFVAEAVGPARADGALNETIADGLGPAKATIFVAKKFITMEPENPTATAVAVAGDKILAVGSLEQVKAALGAEALSR